MLRQSLLTPCNSVRFSHFIRLGRVCIARATIIGRHVGVPVSVAVSPPFRYRPALAWQLIRIDALLNAAAEAGKRVRRLIIRTPLSADVAAELGACANVLARMARSWRQRPSGSMTADAAVVRRGRRPPPAVRRPPPPAHLTGAVASPSRFPFEMRLHDLHPPAMQKSARNLMIWMKQVSRTTAPPMQIPDNKLFVVC